MTYIAAQSPAVMESCSRELCPTSGILQVITEAVAMADPLMCEERSL